MNKASGDRDDDPFDDIDEQGACGQIPRTDGERTRQVGARVAPCPVPLPAAFRPFGQGRNLRPATLCDARGKPLPPGVRRWETAGMTTQRLPFPVPDERAHLFADKVRMTPVSALATRIAALRPVPELVPVTIATFLVFFLGCGRAWVV
ncbi:hypothetical protein [Streptomyces flaveolus]|uniref:Uncharacterized protein n=1 Tax=Streptomyces flaveolus TaxID=67297 RepID=A0ABV3AD72_9ACTN